MEIEIASEGDGGDGDPRSLAAIDRLDSDLDTSSGITTHYWAEAIPAIDL